MYKWVRASLKADRLWQIVRVRQSGPDTPTIMTLQLLQTPCPENERCTSNVSVILGRASGFDTYVYCWSSTLAYMWWDNIIPTLGQGIVFTGWSLSKQDTFVLPSSPAKILFKEPRSISQPVVKRPCGRNNHALCNRSDANHQWLYGVHDFYIRFSVTSLLVFCAHESNEK